MSGLVDHIVCGLRHRAWLDINGEAPGAAPAEFRILPAALQLIGLKSEFL